MSFGLAAGRPADGTTWAIGETERGKAELDPLARRRCCSILVGSTRSYPPVRPILSRPKFVLMTHTTALFVWMSRCVATAFPLTLSLSPCGRGNPRTASSYKCKPLQIVEAIPAPMHYLCAAEAAGTTYSGNFVAGAPCTIV